MLSGWIRRIGVLVSLWMALGPVVVYAAGTEPELFISPLDVGLGRYALKTWGTLAAVVTNPASEPREYIIALSFDLEPDIQFCRRVWMPPASRRKTWLPLRAERLSEGRAIPCTARLIESGRAGEVAVVQLPVLLLAERTTAGDRGLIHTGMVASGEDLISEKVALASRAAGGYDQRMVHLRPAALPPVELGYELLDQLVVAHDEMTLDTAQIEALRRWIAAGGRLWVMLDRVGPGFLAQLLGRDWQAEVIDQVELDDFILEGPGGGHLQTEKPIPMVRIASADMQVIHRVGFWPASLYKPIGRGALIVTTVGARAWLTPTGEGSPAVEYLARYFNVRSRAGALAELDWWEFVSDQIGYRIVSRGVVGLTLSLLVIVLVAAAWFLRSRGRLEHIGWVSLLAVLLTSAALLAIGSSFKQEVPRTLISASATEVVPSQKLAISRGQMQIYSRDDRLATLYTVGGTFTPDLTAQRGTLARLFWNDQDQAAWTNFHLREHTVSRVDFACVFSLSEPIQGQMTFSERGLELRLSGLKLEQMEDTLVAGSNGHLAPRRLDAQSLLAGPDDVLPPTQFVRATLAAQQQLRRQNVYRQLFSHGDFPSAPVFLGWTEVFPVGARLDQEARMVHWTLLAVPLEMVRPEAGRRIVVPSPLLPFALIRDLPWPEHEARRLVQGRPRLPAIYDPTRRTWVPFTQSGVAMLRFDVPRELLPLQLEQARFELVISAPGRLFKLYLVSAHRDMLVEERFGPLDRQEFLIRPPEPLTLEPDDALCLLMDIGPSPAGTEDQQVRIRQAALELTATVLPRP